MSKRTRIILIVLALAVAAYLVYRWYTNNQANTAANDTGLGSNLNSVAPALDASQGADSGLNYTAGTTMVDLTLPSGEQSTSTNQQNSGGGGKKPPPPKKKKGKQPKIIGGNYYHGKKKVAA